MNNDWYVFFTDDQFVQFLVQITNVLTNNKETFIFAVTAAIV